MFSSLLFFAMVHCISCSCQLGTASVSHLPSHITCFQQKVNLPFRTHTVFSHRGKSWIRYVSFTFCNIFYCCYFSAAEILHFRVFLLSFPYVTFCIPNLQTMHLVKGEDLPHVYFDVTSWFSLLSLHLQIFFQFVKCILCYKGIFLNVTKLYG